MLSFNKKALSLLLSIVVCFTAIVPGIYSLANETDESEIKNNLIDAWEQLAEDSKEVTEVVARPGNYNSLSPIAITPETSIEGLSNVALLGDSYYDKLNITSVGWSKQYNFVKDTQALALTEYSDVFMYACGYDSTGNQTKVKISTQVNSANTKTNEFTGWNKIEVAKATGGIKFVIESGTNLASLSFGCVVGKRTVNGEPLPANYDELSLTALVNRASLVDYSGFASGEDFRLALSAAKQFISASEDAEALNNLIAAWTKLADEEISVTENIAYPMPNVRQDVDESIKETYGLSDAEYEALGGVYAYVEISSSGVFFRNIEGVNGIGSIKSYDSISVFIKTFDENGNESNGSLTFQVNQGNDGSAASYPNPQTLNPKWIYTIQNTNTRYADYFNDVKTVNNFKFTKNSGCKYVLVGAFRGNKTVSGTPLPDSYADMSLAELVIEARKVSTEGFETAEEFNLALVEAEKIASASLKRLDLIAAWTELADEEISVTENIAYPMPNVRQDAVESIKETYGLSDAEYEALGGVYAYVEISSSGVFFRNIEGVNGIGSIKSYDSISVFIKTFDENGNESNGSLTFQVNQGNDGSAASYPNPQTLSPKWIYTIQNTNTRYADYFNDVKTVNNFKFTKNSGCKYVLVGAFRGNKTVSGTPLPDNYADMSLAELVVEAKKVSTEGFNAAGKFNAALTEAEKAAGPDLIRLELVSAWTKLSTQVAEISENIAYPMPNVRQDAVESIKETYGLSDAEYEALGGVYAYVEIPSSGILLKNVNGLDGIGSINGYDSISVFIKTFDEDGNESNGSLTFQVNQGNDGSAASYPNPQTLNPKWIYTIQSTNTRYADYFNDVKTVNNFKFTKNSGCKYVLVGAFRGNKTVSGTPLPENYAEMSFAEFVVEANKVPYSAFDCADEFGQALEKANDYLKNDDEFVKGNLISAWQKIASESKLVKEKIAYPMPSDRKVADASIKSIYGLSDFEYEALGGVYAYIEIPSSGVLFKNINGSNGIGSIKDYDSISVFIKTFDEEGNESNGSLTFQVNEGNDGSAASYPNPQTLNPQWIYTIKNTNTRYVDYFTDAKTVKNFKFIKNSGFKYLLVGAFVGNKMVSAEALPEDYESMDLRVLTKVAMSIDYEGFESSELFADALKSAMAFLDVSEVYFRELLDAINKLPVTKPDGIEKFAFEDLVVFAESIDTTGLGANTFKEKLEICKQLLIDRKNEIIKNLEELGLTPPANSDELIPERFVEEVLKLDIASVNEDKSKLAESIASYYSLTETGQAIDILSSVWSKIDNLPQNSEFLLPSQWVSLAENIDVSSANEAVRNSFNNALDTLKDLLTKGKADFTELEDYVSRGKTMNSLDFTSSSFKIFENVLYNADYIMSNKERTTQNKVDSAFVTLRDAWGTLEVYNRTLWVDFLEYYTGENPEAKHNCERAEITYSAIKMDKLHNGINTGLKISGQPGGWYPVNHYGVQLENLMPYGYIEFYFKATTDKFTGNALTIQLQTLSGDEWYNTTLPISSSDICGEWRRIELPLKNFSKTKAEKPDSLKLSQDSGFKTNKVRIMSEGGTTNEYEISSLVVISTTQAQPGVIPDIPKLVIKERVEEEIMIPKNPFTGVDRNDPWGILEKAQNKGDDSIIAGGKCGDNVEWSLDDEGNLIISGSGNMDDFSSNVPWKNYRNDILTVKIENGVTSVGDEAFYNCSNLLKVDLAKTVTSIGDYAFYNCNKLTFIEIPKETTHIGEFAIGFIYNEKDGSSVAVKDFGIYGTTGTTAEEYAKEYGLNFFATALGDTTVKEEEVVVEGTGECGKGLKWTFTSDGLLKITGEGKMDDFDDVTPWEAHLFDITKVVIDDGVESIGNCAFYGCKYLTEVEIPDSVEVIGEYAFYECNLLQTVKIPANTTLKSIAFGFIYDKENNSFAKTPNFTMQVAGGSPAHKYAKDNEIAYTLYTGSEEDLKDDNSSQVSDDANNGNNYLVWIIVASGVLLIAVGVVFFFVLKKQKKNR